MCALERFALREELMSLYWRDRIQKPARISAIAIVFLFLGLAPAAAQGPAPETAPPLFPGGALLSYNSVIETRGPFAAGGAAVPLTARPTFSHEGMLNFTWGFHPNFDVTVLVPILTDHFTFGPAGKGQTLGGTALGDAELVLKYRFYRRDSPRGTSQASFSAGPKLPTGGTGFTDGAGRLLPAGLQAGSGSTDLFLQGNFTYTGLFGFRRLVADEDVHGLLRSRGTQSTRLGSEAQSRFWLSYRPYESSTVSREWFIGPALTWTHMGDDQIAGVTQNGSGGDALLLGIASYVGVAPGTHLWVGVDWDVAHSVAPSFMPVRRHFSFGVTHQFRFRL